MRMLKRFFIGQHDGLFDLAAAAGGTGVDDAALIPANDARALRDVLARVPNSFPDCYGCAGRLGCILSESFYPQVRASD